MMHDRLPSVRTRQLSLVLLCCSMLLAGAQAQDIRGRGGDQTESRREERAAAPAGGDGSGIAASPVGSRYRLTPSDVMELRFPYVPEFDQTVTVQPDGYVSLRVVGEIRVQGRTLPELRELLLEAYAGVLRDPVIDIVLREFERPSVIVAGEVVNPGRYELRGVTTLTQALVLAGGPTRAAKHSQVVLFRQFSTDWLEVRQLDVKKMYASRNLSEDPVLHPGDTVFVPKSALARIAPFIPRPGIGLYLSPLTP